MATTVLLTAEEFERVPSTRHAELIRGELYEMPPPGGRHGWLQVELGASLHLFVKAHRLGRVYVDAGFVIARDPDTVLGPDVAFVRTERVLPEDDQIGHLRQTPDLVIEIVSPSDEPGDVQDNASLYLRAGVPLVWIVDPQRRRVVVWKGDRSVRELGPSDTLDGGEVLPGFLLPLTEIFR